MNIEIIIGIVIVAIVAAAVIIVRALKERASRKKDIVAAQRLWDEEQRPAREWIAAAEKARYNDEALVALGPPPAGWEEFEGIPWLIEQQSWASICIEDRAARRREAYDKLVEIRQESDHVKRYEMLLAIPYQDLANGTDKEWVEEQRRTQALLYTTTLLDRARSGDRHSFTQLNKFTRRGARWWSGSQYFTYTDTSYDVPGDWDELVVRFIETPALDDFRNINTKPADGQVRQLAATALKNRSLKDAQIALAFCAIEEYITHKNSTRQIYWPKRDEIGDVLMAELAKMVVEIHADHKMFSNN